MSIIASNKVEQDKAIRDMSAISFHFLLQVGKYTYYKASDKWCTKNFQFKGIIFWHYSTRLNSSLPKNILLGNYTAETLIIKKKREASTDHPPRDNPHTTLSNQNTHITPKTYTQPYQWFKNHQLNIIHTISPRGKIHQNSNDEHNS